MKTIKRYLALILVLTFIGLGCLLLMFDYDTNTMKWTALLSSAVSFTIGITLGYVFNRKNLLPE